IKDVIKEAWGYFSQFTKMYHDLSNYYSTGTYYDTDKFEELTLFVDSNGDPHFSLRTHGPYESASLACNMFTSHLKYLKTMSCEIRIPEKHAYYRFEDNGYQVRPWDYTLKIKKLLGFVTQERYAWELQKYEQSTQINARCIENIGNP